MESQISALLLNTLSPQNEVVAAASESLENLSALPAFPLHLLSLASGGGDRGVRIAAAAYLKNYVRKCVDGGMGVEKEFRDRLAEAVLVADASVLKLLDEAFRLIVQKEFVKENSWPELVPQLRGVIENSNLICKTGHSQWKTVNALTMVQTMTKCFQYFLNPKVAKEPVPLQLDLIAKDILVPLLGTFHEFVDKVLSLQDQEQSEYEEFILKICNCMYFAVRSYMPSALSLALSSFCHDLFRLLDSVRLSDASVEGYLLRLKIAKRSLIFFCALVTRHRRHSDKLMSSIVSSALKIAKCSNDLSKLNSRAERIISLAFDVISHVLETGPGWRIVSPHFSTLLEAAIFPALALNQKDIEEWEEDSEEYVRKNLPSDLDESSGWAEDLFTARKSAINLLGVVAMSKGPLVACAASKRKMGEKKKGNRQQSSMGELIVLPFFSKFPMPHPGDHVSSNTVLSYYAVLMAYGALQEFLVDRNSEHTTTLIKTRVLPVYSKSSSPYLFATANWVLGQLASCLPQELSSDIYGSLLAALTMPEIDSINFYPVRASAAGAIAELIENEYVPPDWFAMLQVLVNRMDGAEEIELSLLFHLVSTVLEARQDNVVLHVPDLVSRMANAILKHLPPMPEPWPQVVEKGFSSLAAICQTWEASEPDETEQNKHKDWQNGQAVLARTLSNLLQQAWLVSVDQSNGASSDSSPPPSCIDDTSSLLQSVMRSVNASEAQEMKIKELLAVWVHLIADWQGWEELEDLAIFNCIQEAVNMQRRCYPSDFFLIRIQSQTSGSASYVIEGISAFVNQGIAAYPSAMWRACLCVHALLHVPLLSPEGDAIRESIAVKFAQAAFSRFKDLDDKSVGLWKPLLLAISSCYLLYPKIIKQALEECEGNSFFCFASNLAQLSASTFTPGLTSVPEAKLAVITLLKLVESILSSPLDSDNKILFDCLASLMDTCIHLRELVEEEEEEPNDNSDGENDDNDDEDDEDEDDDEESDDDHEETEEEFLERYAKAADELSEMIEEGDMEEGSQEIELGPFQEFDTEEATISLLQNCLAGQTLPSSLVDKIAVTFPQFASLS